MTFGDIIAEARKKLGLSQEDLALRIKKEDGSQISPQYLNDIERDRRNPPIERDRRNPPSEFLIAQFATELNLSKDYLILAAGCLPNDLTKKLTGADPAKVEQAFQAFRRQINH